MSLREVAPIIRRDSSQVVRSSSDEWEREASCSLRSKWLMLLSVSLVGILGFASLAVFSRQPKGGPLRGGETAHLPAMSDAEEFDVSKPDDDGVDYEDPDANEIDLDDGDDDTDPDPDELDGEYGDVAGDQEQADPDFDPEEDAEDLELHAVPAGESWSFDLELAPSRASAAVPSLYSTGCEDTHGWTNGHEGCSNDSLMAESFRGAAADTSLCRATGYTCAAYAAADWCGQAWAVGPFANDPERHCCACGGGITVAQLTAADCGRASGHCLRVVQYTKYVGIRKHPRSYPGLRAHATLDEVQAFLHKEHAASSQCPAPCQAAAPTGKPIGEQPSTETRAGSRGDAIDGQPMKCPPRVFNAKTRKGPAFCFAQLASNRGVTGTPCACRQGCSHAKVLVANTNETVTFRNMKSLGHFRGACSRDVLLTVPREYYKHYTDVLARCGREGLTQMFEMLLLDAFSAFTEKVCRSALWQCFHSPRQASVPYLHIQTFSAAGYFHGMPSSNRFVSICVKQSHREESKALAKKLASMV